MTHALSMDDLARRLGTVTSRSDARAVISRASRITRAPHNRPLAVEELLSVCTALAAEGGAIQQLAESIAAQTLEQ